jgi:hypothetical protein
MGGELLRQSANAYKVNVYIEIEASVEAESKDAAIMKAVSNNAGAKTITLRATAGAPQNAPLNCRVCGARMVWENPSLPGHWHESSCYLWGGWPICDSCMTAHCLSTSCLNCEYGDAPDCQFAGLKQQAEEYEREEGANEQR